MSVFWIRQVDMSVTNLDYSETVADWDLNLLLVAAWLRGS